MSARRFIETLREWAHRAWGTFRATPGELERELETHLEMAEEELRRKGYSSREAARLARLRFDTVPRALDALREQRGVPRLGRFSLDVTLGLRRLRKSWGLTVIGGLAMTIAITIAAGGFSFVRALSGGPVPLDEGDRVVALQAWNAAARSGQSPAPDDFERWRDELRSVDDLGAPFRRPSRHWNDRRSRRPPDEIPRGQLTLLACAHPGKIIKGHAAVAVLLLFACALASYLPARRAASIDPMETLRAE